MSSDAPVKTKITVGSRKSELALIQTHHVIKLLGERYPDIEVDIVAKTTTGDQILDKALSKIGEKSLFTKELETSLESKEVDLVVHSLKDLPTTLPPKMVIGAILERENPCDAVILRKDSKYTCLSDLPDGSFIGTSSVRRAAQLSARYPKLVIKDVRGNLNTRLRKLDADDNAYAALILAVAGVERMGWKERISEILQASDCLHAVGQGALAIECRDDDSRTLALLTPMQHHDSTLACVAERAFMRTLEGGCSAPVAAHAQINVNRDGMDMDGGVWSLDGLETRRETAVRIFEAKRGVLTKNEYASVAVGEGGVPWGKMDAAEKLGMGLAESLLEKGAGKILEAAKVKNQAK